MRRFSPGVWLACLLGTTVAYSQKETSLSEAEKEQLRNQPTVQSLLTAAKELRGGVEALPTPDMGSPDIIANMGLDLFFDYIGMRLNGPKASGKHMQFNLSFPDVDARYRLEVKNAVLQVLRGRNGHGCRHGA